MALNQYMPMDQEAPIDPNMMEQAPAEGEELATPEQVQSLWDLMDQIETKYREMNAEKFAGGNQTESKRKDLVIEVFKALQTAGIDISNVEEVRNFLDELQQSNPDLYQIFVDSFNGLLGGDQALPTDTGEIPQDSGTTSSAAGALGAMPGSSGVETLPSGGAVPNGVPSNAGLSGMAPPAEVPGITSKFPNLAK